MFSPQDAVRLTSLYPPVGFLVVSCNDLELSKKMYSSLVSSVPANNAFAIQVVDAGSTDGSVEFWQRKSAIIGPSEQQTFTLFSKRKPQDYKSLAVCLNDGMTSFLRNNQIDFICHIHPDMEFPETGWMNKMIDCMKKDLSIAKLGVRLAGQDDGAGDGPGNQCPWMMRRAHLEQIIKEDGAVFDEGYVGIGGYEDWDLARRIVNRGWKVWITNDTRVKHIGAGTRFAVGRNTNPEMQHNAHYYQRKWGTNKPVV